MMNLCLGQRPIVDCVQLTPWERASEPIQARYVRELLAWARRTRTSVFLFEAFDAPWKGDPTRPEGAEKHWGLWNVDRTPKQAGMRLRKEPVRPTWTPLYAAHAVRIESWSKFISEAYWNAELEK